MITTDLVYITPVSDADRGRYGFSYGIPPERAEEWLRNYRRGPVPYEIRPWRVCQCCGANWQVQFDGDIARCRKHLLRNPCLIEGCKRSQKIEHARYYGNDRFLCGQHWRELVPRGSPERKVYNRFFRRAKRYGWTDESKRAFYRFWAALASRVRARARGDVDMDEINRIMGW